MLIHNNELYIQHSPLMKYWDRVEKREERESKRMFSSIEIQLEIKIFTSLRNKQDLSLRLTTLPFEKMVYNTIINHNWFHCTYYSFKNKLK